VLKLGVGVVANASTPDAEAEIAVFLADVLSVPPVVALIE